METEVESRVFICNGHKFLMLACCLDESRNRTIYDVEEKVQLLEGYL